MERQFKISLLGAGRIGAIHAANIANSTRAMLANIADVNGEAAQHLAQRHGARVASVDEAINAEDVDAVFICSSTDTHADLIEQAAFAGKAVFCEKPVDLSLSRVDKVMEMLRKFPVKVFVAFNRRFDPTLGGACQAAANGEAGDVETVIITSRDPSPPPVEYVRGSGGLFLDMMIHDLDLACWALGELPVEVFARGSALIDPAIGDAKDVDTAVVTLITQSGKMCQISNSRRSVYGYDQRLEIFGSKGMIRAENRTARSIEIWHEDAVRKEKPMWFFLERYEEAYRNELEHFLDVLEGVTSPLVGLGEARAAMTLAIAAAESVHSGQPVRV